MAKRESKIVGYIAVPGGPFRAHPGGLVQFTKGRPVLGFTTFTTIFPSRAAVKKAIKQTQQYAKERGYKWDWWDTAVPFSVRRV
jgi:hypothetical protein